ncbi:site-specific DNA-methyltransferase [Lactobacillus sp. CC-MHH1034]|uniref:DNA methyltransferase n=1 Tax=Agrilactobacillus fermenti TaxID=2586909 RepID=UPI001E287ADA|nr:DNA methyltransferase [Agrilactobacillus fermenti]MCD2257449.1 site-specific DNA-methyltransferase [Agrilactobacillus fermenti]
MMIDGTVYDGSLKKYIEKSNNWIGENQLIVGENFKVLRSLEQSNIGKVFDLMYIDAPYNTGNEDFVGKEKGTCIDSWSEMIQKRLEIAREFIKKDGFIIMSIDDHEIANTRTILDKTFGKENYVATFVWQRRDYFEGEKDISFEHEYFVSYRMSSESKVSKRVSTFIIPEKVLSVSSYTRSAGNKEIITSEYQNEAKEEINKRFNQEAVTNYPKPVRLLKRIFEVFLKIDQDNKVLDIFSGSGTTAESILRGNYEHNKNNTFTLVQMPKLKKDKVYGSVENLAVYRITQTMKDLKMNKKLHVIYSE